jgi:hypothetical protein
MKERGITMSHRLAVGLAIASMIFLAPRPAAAGTITTTVFDTVDSVEGYHAGYAGYSLTVKGIPASGTTPTTSTFHFDMGLDSRDAALVERCERFAVLVMSKPGKYQLSITWEYNTSDGYKYNRGCKLILRTP